MNKVGAKDSDRKSRLVTNKLSAGMLRPISSTDRALIVILSYHNIVFPFQKFYLWHRHLACDGQDAQHLHFKWNCYSAGFSNAPRLLSSNPPKLVGQNEWLFD